MAPLNPPTTPPRQRCGHELPQTPATPRFGTFEDMPTPTSSRRGHRENQSLLLGRKNAVETPQRIKQPANSADLLFTPRPTPRKHRLFPMTDTPQRGSGRIQFSGIEKRQQDVSKVPSQAKEALIPADNDHPHAAKPSGPGLWYVFRGKRIFRPLPPGAERPEPKVLFADLLKEQKSKSRGSENLIQHPPRVTSRPPISPASEFRHQEAHASEEDTDVEW